MDMENDDALVGIGQRHRVMVWDGEQERERELHWGLPSRDPDIFQIPLLKSETAVIDRPCQPADHEAWLHAPAEEAMALVAKYSANLLVVERTDVPWFSRRPPTDAIKAMERQRDARIEIGQRADAFVAQWSREADRYRKLRQGADIGASNKARAGLADMAKSLQRDPQLESLLRGRRAELGLKPSATGSLSHDLQQWLGRSRDRGLSL